jgi:HEAT repeat protein
VLSLNEKLYLKRRGYATEEPIETGPPVSKDIRLISLIESLGDLSPFARQRAAEALSRMCEAGQRDSRMLPSLAVALNDSDASVRSTVAAALGNLGNAEAVDSLKQRLEIEESIHVRGALQKALQRLEASSLKT